MFSDVTFRRVRLLENEVSELGKSKQAGQDVFDGTRKCMTNIELMVLTPKPKTRAADIIIPGSGIVAVDQPLNDERLRAYYEGNLYDWPELDNYEVRLFHAAGRLIENYPTMGRGYFCGTDFDRIGDYENGRFYPCVPDSAWSSTLASDKEFILSLFPDARLVIPTRNDLPDFPKLEVPLTIPTWAIAITFNGRQVLVGMDYLHSQENAWADAVRFCRTGVTI